MSIPSRALARRATATRLSTSRPIRTCAGDRSDRIAADDRRQQSGVRTQPNMFYMGTTGGGVWKTDNYGITWVPVTDGQISTGSIGAIDVSDSNPNVIYVGTGSEAIRSQRDSRARNVQVDGRGSERGSTPGCRRSDRSARSRFIRRTLRRRTSPRSAIRLAGDRAGRVPDEGRREDLAESPVHQRPDRYRLGRDELVESQRDLSPARGVPSESPGRSSAADLRPRAASTSRPTAAITGLAWRADSPTI